MFDDDLIDTLKVYSFSKELTLKQTRPSEANGYWGGGGAGNSRNLGGVWRQASTYGLKGFLGEGANMNLPDSH